MPNFPTISVIVPVFNAHLTLEACIKSLLEVDYPENRLELVFIDNNSFDGSLEILEKYAGKIKILKESKQGRAAASNTGIKNSAGEIIVFIDADCCADRLWLMNLVGSLISSAGIAVTGGRILSKVPCNFIEKYGEKIHDHDKAINATHFPYVITMNMAIYKKIFFKIGLFDEDFIRSSDSDFSLRLYANGYKIKYVHEAVITHQNEKTFTSLFREGFTHGCWRIKVLKKYSRFLFKNERLSNRYLYKIILTSLGCFIRSVFFLKDDSCVFFCDLIFNLGKLSGSYCGSIKFKFLIC